jgi:hypothetical protein
MQGDCNSLSRTRLQHYGGAVAFFANDGAKFDRTGDAAAPDRPLTDGPGPGEGQHRHQSMISHCAPAGYVPAPPEFFLEVPLSQQSGVDDAPLVASPRLKIEKRHSVPRKNFVLRNFFEGNTPNMKDYERVGASCSL